MADVYQDWIDQTLRPRCLAFLNSIRTTLIATGVASNRITISEPNTIDLQFMLVATRGARTATIIIELTDNVRLGGLPEGKAVLTLRILDGITEISTTYTRGNAVRYVDIDGLDELLIKLTNIESKQTEVLTKTRTAVGL